MLVTSKQLLSAAIALYAVCSATPAGAVPTSAAPRRAGTQVDHALTQRAPTSFKDLSEDELVRWTEEHRAAIRTKYASKLKASHHNEERRKRDLQKRRSDEGLLRRADVGSESLTNYQQDSSWYAPVTIGTPGQTINMVLDTGSADMWTVQNDTVWQPSESSTFSNSTSAFSISYGSGDVAGTLVTDKVQLAGHNASSQTFALATSVSRGLLGANVEGIMGMGFQSLSTANAVPFWQNVGVDIFSFYLRAASLSSSKGYSATLPGGIVTLGGVNGTLYTGDINYSDVIEEAYWLITLGGLTSSGNDVDLDGMYKVAVDTGTTLIGAPDAVVSQIYANVEGSRQLSSGYYTFPCSTSGLNATIHLGNQEYLLTSGQLIAGTTDNQGNTCLGSFFGFGSSVDDQLQYILGDAFLRNVYTIFDNTQRSGARVGFASLAEGLGTNTTSRTVNQVVAANGAVSAMMTHWSSLSIAMIAITTAALTVVC